MFVKSAAGKHLGGFAIDGDRKTLDPGFVHWVQDFIRPATLIDIGSGPGHLTALFAANGVEVVSIDGAPEAAAAYVGGGRFYLHDFTTGPFELPGERFDLALAVEFVEHVEAEHLPNIIAAAKLARRLVMTHATPGQGGYHHVNCKPSDYWIDNLTAAGFAHRPTMTDNLRQACGVDSYYRRTALVFDAPRKAPRP